MYILFSSSRDDVHDYFLQHWRGCSWFIVRWPISDFSANVGISSFGPHFAQMFWRGWGELAQQMTCHCSTSRPGSSRQSSISYLMCQAGARGILNPRRPGQLIADDQRSRTNQPMRHQELGRTRARETAPPMSRLALKAARCGAA